MWGFSFSHIYSIFFLSHGGGRSGYGNCHFFFLFLFVFFVGGRGLVGWSVLGVCRGFFSVYPYSTISIYFSFFISHRMGWAFTGLIRWFLFCPLLLSYLQLSYLLQLFLLFLSIITSLFIQCRPRCFLDFSLTWVFLLFQTFLSTSHSIHISISF